MVDLAESGSAVVGADGTARISLGPLRAFENWDVRTTTVTSTSTTLVPEVRLYRGSVSPSRLIDGTYSGQLNTTDTAYKLRSGDRVVAHFQNADVGSVCTVTIEGETNT